MNSIARPYTHQEHAEDAAQDRALIRAAVASQYTYGRSLYVAGKLLQDCATIAERAGYIGAEADGRRANLAAMLSVDIDEWRLHRDEYDA